MTTRTGLAQWFRRVFVLLVVLFLVATCGTSTSAVSVPPDDPSITPVPPGPTATPPGPTDFVPPDAACPAPPDPVTIPDVMVSLDGAVVVASRGSATFTTCTHVSVTEVLPNEPPPRLLAQAGDVLTMSLPSGWRFLHWEGSDAAVVGEGVNIWPGTDTPDRPNRIDVPVPLRPGDSLATYSLWMISADDRVVGQLEIRVRVRIDP